jgi:Flp pilus assembly protein TadB
MPDPAGQRAERLDARIDRLEDSINHFYKVINELRERLSTMEKKLNALARKDNWTNWIVLADDRVSDADRHEDISRALAFSAGATAAVGRVSTTIWSGGAVAGLYLGTELILRFWVHTHYRLRTFTAAWTCEYHHPRPELPLFRHLAKLL